jgi:hypothetical protein
MFFFLGGGGMRQGHEAYTAPPTRAQIEDGAINQEVISVSVHVIIKQNTEYRVLQKDLYNHSALPVEVTLNRNYPT